MTDPEPPGRPDQVRQLADRLHDGPIQVLTAVNMRLGMLRRRVDPGMASQLLEIEQMVGMALADLRTELESLLGDERPPG